MFSSSSFVQYFFAYIPIKNLTCECSAYIYTYCISVIKSNKYKSEFYWTLFCYQVGQAWKVWKKQYSELKLVHPCRNPIIFLILIYQNTLFICAFYEGGTPRNPYGASQQPQKGRDYGDTDDEYDSAGNEHAEEGGAPDNNDASGPTGGKEWILYIYCVVRKTIRTMMAVQNFELFSNF